MPVLVLPMRVSGDAMPCSTDMDPLHRGILVTENEGLILNCYICAAICDSDHESCKTTSPFLPPVKKNEPWYIKMGLFPSNMTKNENVTAEEDKTTKEIIEAVRRKKKRVSAKPRDRLRILSRAPEFARQDMRQMIKKAKLRTYSKRDPTLIWTFVASTGEVKRMYHEDMGRIQMKKDTLIFMKFKMKDQGIYDCYWRGVLRKRWAITVVPTGEEPFRFRPHADDPNDRILLDRTLSNANIHIFTHWYPWSKCSVCIVPKRDFFHADRYGFFFQNYTKKLQVADDVGAVSVRVGICHVRIINPGIPTRPVNAPALVRYDQGLPCRSHLLPDVMKTLRAIAYRPSEMEIKRCTIRCKVNDEYYRNIRSDDSGPVRTYETRYRRVTGLEARITPFNFALKNGRFTFPFNGPFNNLLKIFPKKQPKRRVVVGKAGKPVTLICPFKGQLLKPFAWYKMGDKFSRDVDLIYENPVDFLRIHNQSRGRIRFDSGFNILIAALEKEDNVKWVCVHNNLVVGYIYVAYMQTLNLAEKAVFAAKVAKVVAPTLIATCLVLVSTATLVRRPDRYL